MKRIPHFLKHNRKGETPSRLLFWDVETDDKAVNETTVQAVLRFGYACFTYRKRSAQWSEPDWQRFTTEAEFWRYVEGKTAPKTRLYLFAHNAAFDFTVCKGFSALRRRGWKLTRAVIDGPPLILQWRKADRTIVVLCTLNYFRSSLKQLGADIGYPKLEMPASDAPAAEWDIYCRTDCDIIRSAMLAYIQALGEWDAGNFQPTLASQAFSAFRHRFMDRAVYIDCNESALELSRAAYYGGRVECFYIGEKSEPLHLLDINSQYPYVMRDGEMPLTLLSRIANLTVAELADYLTRYSVVADVTLRPDRPCYPMRFDSRLVFPVGTFRTVLAAPELSLAIERGHVVQVHSACIYERGVLFRSFVDYFYTQRRAYAQAGNSSYAYLCKILLNSLYGKFGQRGRVFEEIGPAENGDTRAWTEYDADGETVHQYRQFAGVLQELTQAGESANSHPAIAATVTSYARVLLLQMIERAGWENVLYVDTDSLLVNDAGLERLQGVIDPTRLGALKHEKTVTSASLRGAKDYRLGDRTKIKGIRANAEELFPAVFRQIRFSGLRGMLRAGDLDSMLIFTQVKHLTRHYRKGTVLADGTVLPLTMDIDGDGGHADQRHIHLPAPDPL